MLDKLILKAIKKIFFKMAFFFYTPFYFLFFYISKILFLCFLSLISLPTFSIFAAIKNKNND